MNINFVLFKTISLFIKTSNIKLKYLKNEFKLENHNILSNCFSYKLFFFKFILLNFYYL